MAPGVFPTTSHGAAAKVTAMSDTPPNDLPLSGDEIAVLDDWMSARGFGPGPVTGLEQLTGGTQNLMVRFTRGDRSFVVRRGPRHLRPRTNDVLRREMRVLDALSGTDVPHPGLIAACPDEDVWPGAAFYLVEPVDGFNAFVSLPEPHASDPGVRHRMGLSMVDALATLASVDHTAIGLGDFGTRTASSNGRFRDGCVNSGPIPPSTGIRVSRCRVSTRSPAGSRGRCRLAGRRESCTATTTSGT